MEHQSELTPKLIEDCQILDHSRSKNSKSENLQDAYIDELDIDSGAEASVMPHEGMLFQSHDEASVKPHEGVKSSQRSESMNSFFNGYVNSNTPLSEFVEQYKKAIISHRDAAKKEDLISMTTTPDLTDMHSLEAHAGKVYCRNIFKLFQNEFMQIFHCQHNKKVVTGVETTYEADYDRLCVPQDPNRIPLVVSRDKTWLRALWVSTCSEMIQRQHAKNAKRLTELAARASYNGCPLGCFFRAEGQGLGSATSGAQAD
ncbi:hypothetical protein POM88_043313 [Heracleum sosnowskyi]|uniref:Protein FAR1-RELATED SEQUENCE n=1 Tax=Heracleum sosnowskyi TaxID=360622 RepID=A0AAD8H1Q8_9APIA|nr:hypothetical protein POM88_043313 [Heracleum sosnowskyi]